jgi:RNase H.
VKFVHVNAHTGIPGNEAADAMAKEEVGLSK